MGQSRISNCRSSEASASSEITPTRSTDHDKRTFSMPLWIAWAAQSILCVVIVLVVIWLSILAYAYFKRLKTHEKVELNEAHCGIAKKNSFVTGRIVAGNTSGDTFPWTVIVVVSRDAGRIRRRGTGALVTPFHVLTAAHLVPNPNDTNELYVLYGSNVMRLMRRVEAVGVRYTDSGFQRKQLKNDIMLVLLETGLKGVPLLCVPPAKASDTGSKPNGQLDLIGPIPNEGDNVIIAGFGILGETSSGSADGPSPFELMHTRETVQSEKFCKMHMPHLHMTQDEFCTKTPRTGICRGDSGASAMLAVNKQLVSVGIASSTKLCGHTPDRFIKVDAYTEWLYSSVHSSPENFIKVPM